VLVLGVSTAAQVRSIKAVADGVIVGSAIIKEIERHQDSAAIVPLIAKFVKDLNQ
jgi:tryptophan synthase alpha subunit